MFLFSAERCNLVNLVRVSSPTLPLRSAWAAPLSLAAHLAHLKLRLGLVSSLA
jgi:hypothetical protein